MSGRLPAAPSLLSSAVPTGPGGMQASISTMPTADSRLALSAGQPARDFGQRLSALAERFDQRADTAAAEAGREAGRAAGDADPGATPVMGGGIWRSAFERGATEAAGRRVEIMARAEFGQLAERHAADPQGFEAGVAEFQGRLLKGLPAPVRVQATQTLDGLAGQFRSGIAEQAQRQMAEERLATFQDANTARLASIERLALNAVRDPRLTAQLDAERDNMRADIIAMGPRSAFTFGGITYPPDPTRAGALNPVQMGRIIRQAEDTEREGVALGAFRAGPRSEGWINEFERRELSPGQASGLRPDQVARLTGTMRAEAARDRALAREGRADAREALAPQIEARRIAIAATGSAEALGPLSPALVRRAGLNSELIATNERNEQQLFTARQSLNDPEGRAALVPRLAPGGDLFAADPRRAVALANQVQGLNERDAAARLNVQAADRLAIQQSEAEAAITAGRPAAAFRPIISPEEGRAAGLPPERVEVINAEARRTLRITAAQAEVPNATPERLAEIRASLAQDGPGAGENRQVLEQLERAQAQRATALARDPAAYAVAQRPELQRLQQQALESGEPGAMGRFTAALIAAQADLGVPPGQRQPLPRAILDNLGRAVGDATSATTMAGSAGALLGAVGPERLREALAGITGPQAEVRREAVAVASMLQSRDPALARQIMQGALLLRDNPVPALTTAAVEAEADRAIGNAFRALPSARSQVVAAARALYAAEAGERGELAKAFDRDRFAAAIERVQPMASYGSGTVPLPPGLDARGLSALMSDLPAQALAGAMAGDGRAITPGLVARGGFDLTARGAGRYELTYGGRQVLDARGMPFLLNLAEVARMPGAVDPPPLDAPVVPRLRMPVGRARESSPAAQPLAVPPASPPAPAPVDRRAGLREQLRDLREAPPR